MILSQNIRKYNFINAVKEKNNRIILFYKRKREVTACRFFAF